MIVRDEQATIQRCLDSVHGFVDTWVICDTGSTDRTPALVSEALVDLPGALLHHDWVDFGHNRNALLSAASGRADYLLLLDADMTLHWSDEDRTGLDADGYLVRIDGTTTYAVPLLVRDGMGWRYEGTTHEYLATDQSVALVQHELLRVRHHADGGSRGDKLERDERLLRARLAEQPDDVRATFYLAQTMRDAGRREEALDLYLRRAALGGWDEEVFVARLEAGRLLRDHDWERAVPILLEAWDSRPTRAEPLYELAFGYRCRGQHHAAHLMAARAVQLERPDDLLFVDRWIYDWGARFELSVAAWWVGDQAGALAACDELLARDDLPAEYRAMVERNRTYCVDP